MVLKNSMLADVVRKLRTDLSVSSCNRKKVACAVLMDDEEWSTFINGPPLGQKCVMTDPCGCVHAEIYASMAMVYKLGVIQTTLREFRLVSTHSPCIKCAQALLTTTQWGVHFVELIYLENSNIPNCGLRMLEQAGIKVTLYDKTV